MRITANMVTVTRIVLMPIPGYLLYGGSSELLVALAAIAVLGLTDWLDGIMARREGPSVLGGLLDPIADKIFIAVIYLPLTERDVIPMWMTACILMRDFLVTYLRSSLSLRDAPMRTSTLAKYKTAIQMLGIGYVVLYMASPDSWYMWALIIGPIAVPGSLIVYRLLRRQKQGPRSMTMIALMIVAVAVRRIFGPEIASLITLYVITAMTVVSGFSYLADAWSALRGQPGSTRDMAMSVLDGLLMPLVLIALLGRYDTFGASAALILCITLELSVGGLANLLASEKVSPRFRWIAAKSAAQIILAGTALALSFTGVDLGLPLGEVAIFATLGVTVFYVAVAFWRHRGVYLRVL